MWKKIQAKIREFYHEEDGSELMQWAIIIIIVAVLAGLAYGISGTLSNKLNEASSCLNGIGNP